MKPKHGNTGKQNAAKPANERKDEWLHVRVLAADKARWVKAAPGSLAKWVVETLNKGAK